LQFYFRKIINNKFWWSWINKNFGGLGSFEFALVAVKFEKWTKMKLLSAF